MRLSGRLPIETRAAVSATIPMELLLDSATGADGDHELDAPRDVQPRHLPTPRRSLTQHRQQDERRRQPDGEIADPGRPGKEPGKKTVGVEDEEHHADHAPALDGREQT